MPSVETMAISVAFFAVGVGVLFVRVNPENFRAPSGLMPGLALFRYRIYRYGVAFFCFALSAILLGHWAGFV